MAATTANRPADREQFVFDEITRLMSQRDEEATRLWDEYVKTSALMPRVAKFVSYAVCILGAALVFFVFGDRLDSLPPFGTGGGLIYSSFIGIVLMLPSYVAVSFVSSIRRRGWCDRAERLIQAKAPPSPDPSAV